MEAFQRGDESAFAELYRRYRDRLVSYCCRLLLDRARAEEATQDVFIKLYEHRRRYEPRSRFSTFLYRIATNHCFNLKARHEVSRTLRDGVTAEASRDAGANPEEATSQRLQLAEIQTLLAILPDNQRAALVLCHYQGLSCREASTVLAVTEQAVKNLVHRARTSLIDALAARKRPTLATSDVTEVSHGL